MGWANCGHDSKGRPIGYAHEATCDHPSCVKQIDRGLSFACGDMHGEDVIGCEGYFCEDHRSNLVEAVNGARRYVKVCDACAAAIGSDDAWHEEDGVLVQKAV